MKQNSQNIKKETPQNTQKKGGGVIKTILMVLFLIATIIFGVLFKLQTDKTSDAVNELNKSNSQKLELTNELNELYIEYDELKTDNDSINSELIQQQEKIEDLLTEIENVKYSNQAKIKELRNQIASMKSTHKKYQAVIDSLNFQNRQLMEENLLVKDENLKVKNEMEVLNEKQVVLEEKIRVASVLSAFDINSEGFTEKGRSTRRSKRMKKIKTCFTLNANAVAEQGTKTVYIRIARPDDYIIIESKDNLFTFGDRQLAYTAKSDFEYTGKKEHVCIEHELKEQQISGKYNVDLFIDGEKIGSSVFIMK